MQPPEVTYQNKFWIFLTCLALAIVVLGGIATSRYGAGVSSDSVAYLAVAQNLRDGNGLYDHGGFPLLSRAPLYSMVLAGLNLLRGFDIFFFGWYFYIFFFWFELFFM